MARSFQPSLIACVIAPAASLLLMPVVYAQTSVGVQGLLGQGLQSQVSAQASQDMQRQSQGSRGVSAERAMSRDSASGPFTFDTSDLETITYSRLQDDTDSALRYADRQTAFSMRVKPAKPEFNREGAFGLNMFGKAKPSVDIESGLLGKNRFADAIPSLHDGLSYSAGIKVEHEDKDIDGTAYVSSSQLGLSYGRLGRVWYGGLDVNLERYADDYHGADQPDVLKLDLTTGMRLGLTGLSNTSPLWLLSLQGNFDVHDKAWESADEGADWFLNPSLFWQNPSFTFSAQVQLPVEATSSDSAETPDYRLRAVFEKQFR